MDNIIDIALTVVFIIVIIMIYSLLCWISKALTDKVDKNKNTDKDDTKEVLDDNDISDCYIAKDNVDPKEIIKMYNLDKFAYRGSVPDVESLIYIHANPGDIVGVRTILGNNEYDSYVYAAGGWHLLKTALDTINITVDSDTTNGNIIEYIFPDAKVFINNGIVQVFIPGNKQVSLFSEEWWESPYKK
jgi:hypothetical protein